MSTVTSTPDDQALKAKHRKVWASGDYERVADTVIPRLGARLVEATGVGPGQRVLDVAAGTGNAAVPAARAGATVTASDLTPELLERGAAKVAGEDLDITWEAADAEDLPYDDATFDAVLSCVGVMFAPHHQDAADELVRVCRPGGTLGLVSWTPEGFIGQMFATMRPFQPAPPPGVQPPPRWGDEAHVRALIGDRVTDLTARREHVTVDVFASPEEFRDFFKHNYGPTLMAYAGLGGDAGRIAELDHELDELARRHDRGDGSLVMDWEYLLVVASRA
jgi:SAM-dependent methyltransferase